MKRLLFLAVVLSTLAGAQWIDFSSQTGSTNLSNVINGKPSVRFGVGAPSGSCQPYKDLYFTTLLVPYGCSAGATWTLWSTMMGLGTASTQDSSAFDAAGAASAAQSAAIAASAQRANNLSDLSNTNTARTNIGADAAGAAAAAQAASLPKTGPSLGATANPLSVTKTAGSGGVTANLLAAKDGSNPTAWVLPASNGCGAGIALSTASSTATFELAEYGVANAVADGTITAGHWLTGGVTPGRVADAGFAAKSSIAITTCLVGIAQASATVGQSLPIELRISDQGIVGVAGPSGPQGPTGAQGPVVNRATSFTVDCTADNLTTERITAGGVAVTVPACSANNVQFWVINTQLGTPSFVVSGSTINGGSTLNALPACVAIAGCTGYKFLQNPALASDWSAVTTTGTAGTNGSNGASGPSGPVGPSGPSGPGGGGASTIDFQGGTSNLTETGAFVTVYSTTVASLAAGSCVEIQSNAVVSLANGGDFKIFVDAVQVAEPFNGASDLSFRLMHCNNHGVQNAQTSFYSLATLTYSGGTVSASTPAYGTPGTSAIDWSTSHVVTLQVKSASGTVTGKYWAVR